MKRSIAPVPRGSRRRHAAPLAFSLAASALLLGATLGVASCKDQDPTASAPAASQLASSAPAPATPSAAASSEAGSDAERQPVYPKRGGPVNPLATRYCDALQALPERRRAECCPSSPSGYAQTDLCVRALSYA